MKRLLYRNVANDVLFQRHFTEWIIFIGFPDTNDFVNVGICKCEFKFTCHGYCGFTSSCRMMIEKIQKWIMNIEKFLTDLKSNTETLGHMVQYNTI